MLKWIKDVAFKKIIDPICERLNLSRREFFSIIILVSIIILSFIYWYFHNDDFSLNLTTEVLGALLIYVLLQVVTSRVDEIGEQRLGFSFERHIKDINGATIRIRVLTTFLDILTDDDKYGVERARYIRAIRTLLRTRRDVRVYFLILDPWAKAALQHTQDFPSHEQGNIRLKIKQTLWALYQLREELKPEERERLHITLYDVLPPYILFQIDNKASIFFHPLTNDISTTERLWFQMDTSLGRFVEHTFDSIRTYDQRTSSLDKYLFLSVYRENKSQGSEQLFYVKSDGEHQPFYLLIDEQRNKRFIQKFVRNNSQHKAMLIDWKGRRQRYRLDTGRLSDEEREQVNEWATEKYQAITFHRVYKAVLLEYIDNEPGANYEP